LGVNTSASGTAGEIRATNDITAFYSDPRLKDFHGTIENALSKVLQLNGYYWKQNDIARSLGYENEDMQVGLNAEEVEKILPEIIRDAPIGHGYKTLDYAKLIPLLIEAIKELERKLSIWSGD